MRKLQGLEALVWRRMEKFSCLAKAVPNSFDLDISGERVCAVPAFFIIRKVYSKEMKTKNLKFLMGF